MSNYTSPLDYDIATLLRESGYQGKDMTYGAALDWIAEQKGVLIWVDFTGYSYYARVNRRRTYTTSGTWKDAMNLGIRIALSSIRDAHI